MTETICEDWNELNQDYSQLEKVNTQYLNKVNELISLQEKCKKHIAHQRYRIKVINKSVNELPVDEKLKKIKADILKREAELNDIEQTLPRKSDRVLVSLILGDVDVSFLSKENKFKYKDDYEKFKLMVHTIAVCTAVLMLYVNFRPLEQLYMGFLIWYYCTISIRESILKVNGSRIKGWWRVHHLLSILSSGLFLIWPNNEPWALFRTQFIWYTIYSGFTQYLQFKYQRGALYRLKALGEMKTMDITLEGFQFWMYRGLTFLMPFLFLAYLFQLSNAITLFNLSYHPEASSEVFALSVIFTIFFLGNTITLIRVIPNKTKRNLMINYNLLTKRFYDAVTDINKK